MRAATSPLFLLAILPLGGCTLESFEVTPCQAGETVGFAIAPIEGLFSDYQPRPSDISLRGDDERGWDEAAMWSAHMPMKGPEDANYRNRPSHRVIKYGQPLAGWETERPAKPLEQGQTYRVHISDGGHNGRAEFEMGKPLPACPLTG